MFRFPDAKMLKRKILKNNFAKRKRGKMAAK